MKAVTLEVMEHEDQVRHQLERHILGQLPPVGPVRVRSSTTQVQTPQVSQQVGQKREQQEAQNSYLGALSKAMQIEAVFGGFEEALDLPASFANSGKVLGRQGAGTQDVALLPGVVSL